MIKLGITGQPPRSSGPAARHLLSERERGSKPSLGPIDWRRGRSRTQRFAERAAPLW